MHAEWVNRKAAVLCFGALAETQDNPEIEALIFNALTVLLLNIFLATRSRPY